MQVECIRVAEIQETLEIGGLSEITPTLKQPHVHQVATKGATVDPATDPL